jgi:hypothetical protein
MHQLHGEDPKLHLQPEKLTAEVRKSLDENPGGEPDKQKAAQAKAPIAPPGGNANQVPN